QASPDVAVICRTAQRRPTITTDIRRNTWKQMHPIPQSARASFEEATNRLSSDHELLSSDQLADVLTQPSFADEGTQDSDAKATGRTHRRQLTMVDVALATLEGRRDSEIERAEQLLRLEEEEQQQRQQDASEAATRRRELEEEERR
ncbi:hypothetical protein LTR16_011879, partial [Cryomyces antarcticus]